MFRGAHFVVIMAVFMLCGPSGRADDERGMSLAITPATDTDRLPPAAEMTRAGVRRIIVGHGSEALARTASENGIETWALQPLFGHLEKLASQHLSAPRDDGAPLRGMPSYAYPEAREALRKAAISRMTSGVKGVYLLADGETDWPKGKEAARAYGFNAPVVEEYQRRYGSDPRKAGPDTIEEMFFVRLKGEHLAAAIREVAQEARRRALKVGIAVAPSETDVRSAERAYLDVEGLLRERAADEIAVIGRPQFNFLYWKPQAYPSPSGVLWARVGADGRGLRQAAMQFLENDTADHLVIEAAPEAVKWREIAAAKTDRAAQRAENERFMAALAAGKYRKIAGVEEPRKTDQATTHGVAQSFTLDKPATAVVARLLVALRPKPQDLIPDLPVELREDRDGAPQGKVLAAGSIAPNMVGYYPEYTWAVARFSRPVRLEAGRTYWIYVPDTPSYVWRTDPSGSNPQGHAWSRRYDYARFDWVFELLAEQ